MLSAPGAIAMHNFFKMSIVNLDRVLKLHIRISLVGQKDNAVTVSYDKAK